MKARANTINLWRCGILGKWTRAAEPLNKYLFSSSLISVINQGPRRPPQQYSTPSFNANNPLPSCRNFPCHRKFLGINHHPDFKERDVLCHSISREPVKLTNPGETHAFIQYLIRRYLSLIRR